ncbi:Maf family protein [Shewanella gaetbuli]|uniref:dTTP/UTP pyrophosphatase n=1 Tax=Shewanella gaetbuli TaxID=220752 RepID=A0A9X1ZQB3_9GAMM|nr:Maf family protein [Shewanella gaetbuli]MCL1142108.1 Maf-like protein [Shewanella gaetbuli]
MTWVLASTSPRRKQLFAQAGFSIADFSFEQVAPDIDETPFENELAADYVTRLAIEKAQAGLTLAQVFPNPKVLGSDTSVVLNGAILGKPVDPQDAKRILQQLSGNTHQVMTAVAITNGQHTVSRLCITDVTFNQLTDAEIHAYIETQEPMDKAGAYGIQAIGGCFVAEIKGSYSAVVGLPLVETRQLMQQIQQV